ncbi:cryptochrome/photolyase family protein [Rhodopila sp.]|uniref:cryptochrome/photolyase family protein n=1 Tax=Rhodopila sp. TaxID=2480087 RepID=UPI003D1143D4
MAVDTLRIILGDQLSASLSALSDLDPAADMVLMAEVMGECTHAPYHLKKLVLVLSAMRHFARALTERGVRVRYVALDDPDNTQTLRTEVGRAVAALKPRQVVVTEPGAHRVVTDMANWTECLEIRPDTRFLCSIAQFRRWAAGRSGLRMEFFYREMRRRSGLLMTPDGPEGNRWNFDAENRKRLPPGLPVPPIAEFPPDSITRDVIALVRDRFTNGFADTKGFAFPVTAHDAEATLADFIAHRLPGFGDWQDAMRSDAPTLFHAVISPALNLGLLDPLAVCQRVETAYRSGAVALNAAEGFIRQIIGWREYVRGIYWLKMPQYATLNALQATRPLPDFYWNGATPMACISQVVGQTRRDAYAHHIQRLMVTGNFALLAGLHPDAVDEWYLAVYADAYQWVEMPNTRGMALFGDGGIVGSKPYAASGAYINRNSNYCAGCAYDVKQATGPAACPFNFLYWDFIARHAQRFASNPRMAMPLRNWQRMAPQRRDAIRAQAAAFLVRLDHPQTPRDQTV